VTKPFDAGRAAEVVFAIMKRLGLDNTKPGRDSWINYDSKDSAVVCLLCNFIWCSVTKDGFSFLDRNGTRPSWTKRSTSYKDFKKELKRLL